MLPRCCCPAALRRGHSGCASQFLFRGLGKPSQNAASLLLPCRCCRTTLGCRGQPVQPCCAVLPGRTWGLTWRVRSPLLLPLAEPMGAPGLGHALARQPCSVSVCACPVCLYVGRLAAAALPSSAGVCPGSSLACGWIAPTAGRTTLPCRARQLLCHDALPGARGDWPVAGSARGAGLPDGCGAAAGRPARGHARSRAQRRGG